MKYDYNWGRYLCVILINYLLLSLQIEEKNVVVKKQQQKQIFMKKAKGFICLSFEGYYPFHCKTEWAEPQIRVDDSIIRSKYKDPEEVLFVSWKKPVEDEINLSLRYKNNEAFPSLTRWTRNSKCKLTDLWNYWPSCWSCHHYFTFHCKS